MKKSNFTESQIIAILKEADAGMIVKGICRPSDTGQNSTNPASPIKTPASNGSIGRIAKTFWIITCSHRSTRFGKPPGGG